MLQWGYPEVKEASILYFLAFTIYSRIYRHVLGGKYPVLKEASILHFLAQSMHAGVIAIVHTQVGLLLLYFLAQCKHTSMLVVGGCLRVK